MRKFTVCNAEGYLAEIQIERRPHPGDPYVRVMVPGLLDAKALYFLQDDARVPLLKALADALGYDVERRTPKRSKEKR